MEKDSIVGLGLRSESIGKLIAIGPSIMEFSNCKWGFVVATTGAQQEGASRSRTSASVQSDG
jgi:hypothetical protein